METPSVMFHLFAGNDDTRPLDNYRGQFPTLEAAWVIAKQYHWAQLMVSDENQSMTPHATMEIFAVTKGWEYKGERTIQGGWRLMDGDFVNMEAIEQTREKHRYGGYYGGGSAMPMPWQPDVPAAPKEEPFWGFKITRSDRHWGEG